MSEADAAGTEALQVVATAGHVDHGKSSLIARLTGIDPDRWEEEKRRGLTIDLGFAWTMLPSGREVGFVDVPGHERFIRNMLAGIGPVRLVLFAVAADEGWKPQSEEHLAIVDVLGSAGAVIALTKRDLVDQDVLDARVAEVRARLARTALEHSPIVPCSSTTGAGLDDVRAALDAMVAAARPPSRSGRTRLAVDRAFTIRGAGTVVTGTLTGGRLRAGQEVEVHPGGATARVRSLQTHRRPVDVATPVSRVAVNLTGLGLDAVERGDVVTEPGRWRPTATLEVRVRAIRGLAHALTARGAYKLYLGSAERDARLRLYEVAEVGAGAEAFARLSLSRPVVADVGDRFVLREAGRRMTTAGGTVLDPHPPRRPGPDPAQRLARRLAAAPDEIPAIVVAERGAVTNAELRVVAGESPDRIDGATRAGAWWISDATRSRIEQVVRDVLGSHHREHPMRPGMDVADARRGMIGASPALAGVLERGLAAAILEALELQGTLARTGTVVRLATHAVTLGEREDEARRLVDAVASGEPAPPSVRKLEAAGFPLELIEAACALGRLARIAPDVVVTPAFLDRAEAVVRAEGGGSEGITVSRFRQLLGTSRKYAMPLLERFDAQGLTRRDGDVRRLVDR